MATKRYELVLAGDVSHLQSALRQATSGAKKLAGASRGLGRDGRTGLSSFSNALGLAGKNAAGTSGQFRLVARSVSAVGDMARMAVGSMAGFIGAQAVISGLSAAWREMGRATIDFDRNMRNVNSLVGMSDAQLGRLSDQVLRLSTRLPQSASELSSGLYDIASSGFAGADGMMVLEASATAASAGISTTATSAKSITAVLNAYGLSAAHAGEVSDTLFQTVNLGVVNFDELSESVGDWVGTAATLGVSIDDASAAFATMTLSGINASEAGTALNRVMLSLIKPSEQMTGLLASWGYESGLAAVESLGLQGVMERIRRETGGTADAMAGLFPEVRGLKGGLALLADEGRNYTRVAKEMGDAHKGVGASQKVLNEQAKSLSYQLKVLGNRFVAGAVAAGRWATPGIAAAIAAVGSALRTAGDWVAKIAERARPGWDAFSDAVRNAARTVAGLVDAFGPLAAVVAGLAALGLVELFNGLGRAVSAVTGFLDRHRWVAAALAGMYLGSVIPALITATAAFRELAYIRVGSWALDAAAGISSLVTQMRTAGSAAAGLRVLGAGLTSALSSPVAVIAAAAVAVYELGNRIASADRKAKQFAEGWLDDADLKSLRGLDAAIEKAEAKTGEAIGTTKEYKGVVGQVEKAWDSVTWGFDDLNRSKNLEKSLATLERLEKERARIARNVRAASGNKNATRDDLIAVERLANTLGFDLTAKGEKGAAAVRLTREAIEKLGRQAGYSSEQIRHAGQINEAALEEQAKAAQEYQQKVAEAFSGGMNLLDVTKGLKDGQQLGAGEIRKFYADQIGQANTFLADLESAYRAGYDPQLLSRLLQAGPEQAGQVLHALVSDTSGGMVELVNNAEQAIRQISTRAVEAARLTQQAITKTDTVARQLPDAMRIAEEKTRQGATATAASIAAALKLRPDDVAAIAASYEIELPSPQVEVRVSSLLAESDLESVRVALEQIPSSVTTTPKVNDPEVVKAWWDDLRGRLELIPGLRETVARIDDPQTALVWWQRLQLLVKGTDGQKALVTASIFDDGVVATLTRARDLLAAIRANPSVTLTVRRQQVIAAGGDPRAAYTGRHEADGGIVTFRGMADGGVLRTRAFAAGSERHVAQIARPGEWRVWAEPETGGEAYIPLASSKRRRSLAILGEVAHRFGLDRGVEQPAPRVRVVAPSTTTINVRTTLHVTGAGDRQLADAFGRALDARDADLARRLRGKR